MKIKWVNVCKRVRIAYAHSERSAPSGVGALVWANQRKEETGGKQMGQARLQSSSAMASLSPLSLIF